MSAQREEIECCICMDTINASLNNCTTPCGHSFCFQCLAKALTQNNTCPCCRAVLVELPEDDDETEYTDYYSDDEEEEYDPFGDEALNGFRSFMVRIEREMVPEEVPHVEVSDIHTTNNDNVEAEEEEEEEDAEEEAEEAAEEIEADVEEITAKLQGRGITMLDLVAMLTERKSTKVAKHTDRFIYALDAIMESAVEACDKEAKLRAQQQHQSAQENAQENA